MFRCCARWRSRLANRRSAAPVALGCAELAVIAAAAIVALGCGDEAHRLGGPGDAEEGGDLVIGRCRTHADLEMIDNMEDPEDTIMFVEGRTGFWFAFNDKTGEQQPLPGADLYPMTRIEPRRGNSEYAVQTDGSGFTNWGAGIGFDLHSRKPYDGSGYAGVSFWARRTPDSDDVTRALRMEITDRNSVPQASVCRDAREDVPEPVDPSGPAQPQCYANFGADIELEDEWTRYSFRWGQLQQAWWDRKYDAIVRSAIYGIRFQVAPNQTFNFQIDDIAFLCR